MYNRSVQYLNYVLAICLNKMTKTISQVEKLLSNWTLVGFKVIGVAGSIPGRRDKPTYNVLSKVVMLL